MGHEPAGVHPAGAEGGRLSAALQRNVSEYRGKLMGAGAAKRDAKIWEEFLSDKDVALPYSDDLGLTFTMHKPQVHGTKWSADYFARVTGFKGRTSEHSRDAALLVYGWR